MEKFTFNDLFMGGDIFKVDGQFVRACLECGSLVAEEDVHTAWHNKVANL